MRLPRGMLIVCALALTGAAPSTRLEPFSLSSSQPPAGIGPNVSRSMQVLLDEEVRTAQAPPAAGTPASGVQAYSFPTGAGLLFFYVRPERTEDFERVVKRLGEVLDKTEDPARKPQAAGWRMFKSAEVPKDSVIYVFVLDPAIAGTDYDPVKVLSEGLPTEAHGLYESLKSATVRIERMGLGRLR